MGAENSKPRTELIQRHLEIALEKQRKLYEIQTKVLLNEQREALTKAQDKSRTEEATSKTENAPTPPVRRILYPDLPVPQNTFNPQPSVSTTSWAYNAGIPNRHQPQTPTAPSLTVYASPLTVNSNETQYSSDIIGGALRRYPNQRLTPTFNRDLIISCPNHLHGCSLRLYQVQMQEHILECPFNDMVCPMNNINGCSWKGKFTNLKHHFEELHPQCQQTEINKEDTLHIAGNYQLLNLITIGTFNFLLHSIVDQWTKRITFGIQLIGSKVSAAKWTFEIRVYDKNSPRRLFEYVDICHSNIVPLQTVLNQSATMCLEHAKTFAHDDIITYKVFLKKQEWVEKKTNNAINPHKKFPQRGRRQQSAGEKTLRQY